MNNMPTTSRLTDESFWISDEETVFSKHDPNHDIYKLIRNYIPSNKEGHCLEIGSFPGPFLAAFGDLGYTLSGIDFHPGNEKELPEWLQRQGYKTGKFSSTDFFSVVPEPIYDVVCSFGFIEHFTNYQSVIADHAAFLKPGGLLLITTPNFAGGIQYWLHKNFDAKNLSHHNIESMQPMAWRNQLEQKHFEVIFSGYTGNFWFWRGSEKFKPFKTAILWSIERIIPRLRKILKFESRSFSAYCAIVAKKKNAD